MSAGCSIPNTPLCVDSWRESNSAHRIFLLSHAHGDHTTDLSETWCHPIYCSEFTADYIERTIGIHKEWLRPLDLNTPHVISLDGDTGTETMTLTLVDANHCPGSVMFLMEGYFGVILHTGDFRYDEIFKKSDSFEILKQYSERVDFLYLDNTYCSPSCVFPPRERCIDKISSLILQHPNDNFVVATRNLGKESLLSEIAVCTKEWISVSLEIYKNIEILDLQDNFIVDDQMCRIRTAPFYSVNEKNVRKWNNIRPTRAIVPSGLYTGRTFHNSTSFYERLHVIPYSDHSSYPELLDFVAFVRPKRVIPILTKNMPNSTENRCNMSNFSEFLKREPESLFIIPESVLTYMHNGVFQNNSQRSKRRKRPRPRTGKRRKASGVVFIDEET